MKTTIKPTIATLVLLALSVGRAPGKNKGVPKDILIPPETQQQILSKTKMPQQFQYDVYRLPGGAVACSGKPHLHPNHFTSANTVKDGFPIIKLQGKSRRSKMTVLLDTSSPYSWIEYSAAKKLPVYFLGLGEKPFPYRGSYNLGGAKAFLAVTTQLRIDQLFIENVPFYVRMSMNSLGPMARGIRDPAIEAVLGFNVLKTFEYVQFDLANGKVAFSATTPFVPPKGPNVHTAKIIPSRSFGLVVEGSVNDEKQPIVIDIAGDFTFARGDIKVATTPAVGVGDLEFLDVPTLVVPAHDSPARVGLELLRPYRITICNNAGLVYFEKLPEKGK